MQNTMKDVNMLPEDESLSPAASQQKAAQIIGGLGALGVALQNYTAVSLFVAGLAKNVMPIGRLLSWSIQIGSILSGACCSGLVNFWMNVELLEGFLRRVSSPTEYQYKRLKLSPLQKLQYFGGIAVFVVTGILFGLMAFTFAMTGPFAVLSVAAGLVVAAIMTIQEVETWLSSYENQVEVSQEKLSYQEFIGKLTGHVIAIGNIFALSLLFTLSLSEFLCALHVAVFPALVIGASVAFSFGAFTEYYFYNFYLASFCQNFYKNWQAMISTSHPWLGLLSVSVNAFVNAALTYAGVLLLADLLLTASFVLPPVAVVVTLSALSAVFSGSASLILGLDFWIRQNAVKKHEPAINPKQGSLSSSGWSLFETKSQKPSEKEQGRYLLSDTHALFN